MVYRIDPELEGGWVLRATIERTAVTSTDDRRFIPSFSLGSNFTSRFIAIGTRVRASYSNWKYGGYVGQEFDFTNDNYAVDNTALYRSQDLLLNSVQILELPLLSSQPYTLRYFPPNWFLDVRVQVWEFVGAVTPVCGETEPNPTDTLTAVLTNQQDIIDRLSSLETLPSNIDTIKSIVDAIKDEVTTSIFETIFNSFQNDAEELLTTIGELQENFDDVIVQNKLDRILEKVECIDCEPEPEPTDLLIEESLASIQATLELILERLTPQTVVAGLNDDTALFLVS